MAEEQKHIDKIIFWHIGDSSFVQHISLCYIIFLTVSSKYSFYMERNFFDIIALIKTKIYHKTNIISIVTTKLKNLRLLKISSKASMFSVH